ncbi:MAG: L-seryl-tRNA(Sec) selenium transferase [Oscillospiraceae bacterium]|nr:L-seryl-tRNA(Sec) selenium transferase [Oscillospiraceae bacterium]
MNDLLSSLPNMNSLTEHPIFVNMGNERVKSVARAILDDLRHQILSGAISNAPSLDECAGLIFERLSTESSNLRRVINATGVVLHTNLGRAPLGKEMLAEALIACEGYNNLEYDLKTGKRGSRYTHVENLICEIIETEAALVVNNNAAAMVLILATLAAGKNVAISRGELVEIGGSFRVPEIIMQSGAELIEIGSTNKTKLSDYADAVEHKNAELLLKVHTSNYEIVGFTQSVSISELSEYGASVGRPVVYDAGSSFLIDTQPYGFDAGETAMSGLKAGADIICFSGDKLMGCAQAGIIAGRSDLISAMKKHPLTRALRPDKLTLSVLESALRQYRYPDEAATRIPVLAMLFSKSDNLKLRAESFTTRLKASLTNCRVDAVEVMDETGGGSLPNVPLPGWAVSIKPSTLSVNALEQGLRAYKTPIIIRIQDEAILVSVRTLLPGDEDVISEALIELEGKADGGDISHD